MRCLFIVEETPDGAIKHYIDLVHDG